MLLQVAKQFAPKHIDLLRVTLQDISPVACDMAFINTTLWDIPTVIWGDTLRMETHARWPNVHWHRVGEEMRRRVRTLFQSENQADSAKSKKEPPPQEPTQSSDQLDLDFYRDSPRRGVQDR